MPKLIGETGFPDPSFPDHGYHLAVAGTSPLQGQPFQGVNIFGNLVPP
jgi:hypothetical protein